MSIVSLFQIFSVTAEELEAVLGINLFPNNTIEELNQNLNQVYSEYRKAVIQKYYENNQLDNASKKIVENKNFYPSLTYNNTTLDMVLSDMKNKSNNHDLSSFYNKSTSSSSSSRHHNPSDYFDQNSQLSENEQKYCRAVLHVAAKQDEWCLEGQKWNQENPDTHKTCYNPYAVASKTVHRSSRPDCLLDLKLDAIPEAELKAEAYLHQMTIEQLYQKQNQMRSNLGLPIRKPFH